MNKQRVYSPGQAAAGSFLGGPLVSIIFLRHNFKVLGNTEGENRTLLFGAIVMLAFIGALPFLPDKFPNMAIPLATIIATRSIVAKYQFTKQDIIESPAMALQSNWRVFWLGLVCAVITFVAIMALMLGLDYFGIIKVA